MPKGKSYSDVPKRYTATQSGKGNDPLREPHALLVRILFTNTDPKCTNCC